MLLDFSSLAKPGSETIQQERKMYIIQLGDIHKFVQVDVWIGSAKAYY